MKRQIQRLLLVTIALFAITNSMHAYDVAIDGIYYNLDNSTATATVTYRADKYSSYSYSNDVVIPSSITYEGNEYSVTAIGEYAFYGCKGLASVTIPESVTEIGNYVFCGCTRLTSITIPGSVTRIGNFVFSSCTDLTSITLSKNLTEIGRGAFNRCSGLTSIDLPESVTTIGENAFQNCNGLTSITIPKSVTTIGNGALSYCSGLTEVLVDASNPAYSSVDGILFNKEQTQIICYPSGKAGNRYTIPNSITSIGAYAFCGCEKLTSITIPSNFTKIEDCAFYGCKGLTSMTIPEGVTCIGNGAFVGCDNLSSITIPSSVTSIGEGAFAENYKIEKVYISDLTAWCNIDFHSYYSNPLINGGNLYLNNVEITNLVIPSTVKEIKQCAFCGYKGMTSVTIPESVTSIGYEAFRDCKGLTFITIPKSVTNIGNYAFEGCTELSSVTIPEGITDIGGGAFWNCTGLTTLTLPKSITSIGNAFRYCKLKSLYLFAKLSDYSECFSTLDTSTILFAYSSEISSISENWSGTVCDIEQPGGGIYVSDCYLRGVSFYVVGNDYVPASLQSVKIGDTEYTPKEDGLYFVTDLDVNTTYDIVATYKVDGDNTHTVTKTIQTKTPSVDIDLRKRGQSTFTISLGVSNDESYTVTKKGVFILGNTYECDGNPFTVSGLKPATSYTVTPFAYYGNIMVTGNSYTYRTTSLQPKLTPGKIGPTTFTATGSYTEGDATVSATGFTNYTEGNNLNLTGLKPNTRYTITYYVKTEEGGEEVSSYTFTTPALQLTTQQPKGVSSTCSIVSATTNISEEEMNVGFQWKKYDAPESLKASEGYAAVFDGQVEGYIKNLQPTSYYNVRAFYKSADGTYYYGSWVTFDPSDFSYFEPTVHTYAVQDVAYTTASVKGYVLSGTDEIKSQGFEYWTAGSGSSNAKAVYATSRTGSVSTVYASGQVMNATLQSLSEGTTYIYRAFVTTANGTFYGDEQTFTTKGDATGIEEVEGNTAERTIVGYYSINGEKRNTPAKGINIVLYSDGSTRKILVK